MKKMALCIGINQYKYFPDNELYGCVNDAKRFSELFKSLGYEVLTLLDKDATYDNIMSRREDMAWNAGMIADSNSSHGSHQLDLNGDEKDSTDEVFMCYDSEIQDNGQFINAVIDDEIYDTYHSIDVPVVMFSDSCNSGTGNRLLSLPNAGIARVIHNPEVKGFVDQTKKQDFLKENPNFIYWSGCKDTEVSYDAYIDGENTGAFTYYWLQAYYKSPDVRNITIYNNMLKAIREEYTQTPQLECSFCNKYKKIKL